MEKTILKTLKYHSLFAFPMKKKEIFQWIYKKQLKQKPINSVLKKLEDTKKINSVNGYYFLPGQKSTLKKRLQKKKYAKIKLQIAKKYAKILSKIPFIKMIAVSGSLAMKNAGKNDDIDLFVITKKNRIWVTRFLSILILEVLGKRRRPKDKKIKNKICLNLFLDEASLEIKNKNIYTAHEVCQIKPVLNKNNIYKNFIIANKWVKKYWPNAIKIPKLENKNYLENKINKGEKNNFLQKFCDFIDCLLFKLQYQYMKNKITNEKVSYHFAFFHPKDRSKKVIKRFEK